MKSFHQLVSMFSMGIGYANKVFLQKRAIKSTDGLKQCIIPKRRHKKELILATAPNQPIEIVTESKGKQTRQLHVVAEKICSKVLYWYCNHCDCRHRAPHQGFRQGSHGKLVGVCSRLKLDSTHDSSSTQSTTADTASADSKHSDDVEKEDGLYIWVTHKTKGAPEGRVDECTYLDTWVFESTTQLSEQQAFLAIPEDAKPKQHYWKDSMFQRDLCYCASASLGSHGVTLELEKDSQWTEDRARHTFKELKKGFHQQKE